MGEREQAELAPEAQPTELIAELETEIDSLPENAVEEPRRMDPPINSDTGEVPAGEIPDPTETEEAADA
jgi:cytochrome P450